MRINMKKERKIGIVCCSNGQPAEKKNQIHMLEKVLVNIGFSPVFSNYIYEKASPFSGTGIQRANALMDFYKDTAIEDIFDLSGGDLANEVLPYLDYDLIRNTKKRFWGYSDLTTVVNAIGSQTGNPSVLYQIRNLVREHSESQIRDFSETMLYGKPDLFDFKYEFIQGKSMSGMVAGGNIRCLLKLAGTRYWPDMSGKILLLESLGGKIPQMATYLNQLAQIGVFEKISGILLGTFTEMEASRCIPTMPDLVRCYAGEKLPIAVTHQIGHGSDSKAIVIGETLTL